MLKEMGKSRKNTVKSNNGKSIVCPCCGTKIYYESKEEAENIVKIEGKRYYLCSCKNDIILK